MHTSPLLLLASTATAFSLPDVSSILPLFARRDVVLETRDGGNCPSKWNDISKELTGNFLTGGQCNPNARAAIRLIFHDCGAWNKAQGAKGGCDGSLVLAGELDRGENKGLRPIGEYVQGMAKKWNTSVADMIGTSKPTMITYPILTPSSLRWQPRHRHLPWRPPSQNLRRAQRLDHPSTRRPPPRRQRPRRRPLQTLPRQRLQRSRSRRAARCPHLFEPIQLQHVCRRSGKAARQHPGRLGR
jgi:hypothetical protein